MGTVISFVETKGYGFIEADDGRHLFFHISDCYCTKEEIRKGVKVVFAIKEYLRNGIQTPKAVNVQLA